ncbi:ABC transporter substrate-binding protein [Microlunatus sp. Gsoil 973]|uniref:ABC transporter substrate-binding protein n=1 Tax=Microlunatus sp. Gsoil 973 TaxID=2672569 RepID=UPI0012B470F8|nr:extracellular solute-binding protein [Microlunatus sp. Gsoil 973]QGN34272.1 extracellular solute-binding protein [Microlunatus sp. Gsoil 973]
MPISRRSLLSAGGLATAALLAGCSSSGSGSPGDTKTGGKVTGKIELFYWGSSSRVDKYNKIDALFQKAHAGTTVEASATDFESYFDKLNTMAASQSMPDVTTMQTRQLNDYTANGVLQNLQPLIDAGQIKVNDIPKSVLDYGRGPDGTLYMIPFGCAWNAITVNQSMAEKAGIDLPKTGYTWDEYADWLSDAQDKLPDGIPAADDAGGSEARLLAYVISNGHDVFTADGKLAFDKSVLAEYWNMWQGFAKSGYLLKPQQSADEPDQLEQFYVTLNKVLSEDTAGNALPGIQAANEDNKMTTLLFPSGSAGLGNSLFVSGYSIPTNSENTATAAAYIDFWTNDDDSAAIFASDNGAVANTRQLEVQIENPAAKGLDQVLSQYKQITDAKVKAPVMPAGYFAYFSAGLDRHYQDVQFGRASVDQAVEAFFKEANSSMGGQ